jgi:hypothetical protein
MLAEAAYQKGITGEAELHLNTVRSRVGLAPVSGITKEDIINERLQEFGFECLRCFDLIRWSGASDINPDDDLPGEDEWADPQSLIENFVKGKNEFWPIPKSDIDINGGKLLQNEGW